MPASTEYPHAHVSGMVAVSGRGKVVPQGSIGSDALDVAAGPEIMLFVSIILCATGAVARRPGPARDSRRHEGR
jgi:hypothetical protein